MGFYTQIQIHSHLVFKHLYIEMMIILGFLQHSAEIFFHLINIENIFLFFCVKNDISGK